MAEGGAQSPIATATSELEAWLSDVVGMPIKAGSTSDTRLSLYLRELSPEQQIVSAGRREPIRFRIRFLLTTAEPAHYDLLDKVLVAALAAGDPTVSIDPVPVELWRALGLHPGPALTIEVPARVIPAGPEAPLIRTPLHLEHVAIRPLEGRLLGPGDLPLAGMRVEVAGGHVTTHSDTEGRFRLAGVPAGQRIALRLSGRQRTLVAEVTPEQDEPVIIHCDFEE